MIKIFADTSDLREIEEMNANLLVKGFTTNPTLMKKAGVTNYEQFCKEVLKIVPGKPVSFEVFADDFDEIQRQARIISGWGENVYVKVPITNTRGEYTYRIIAALASENIKINVTAITRESQMGALIISDVPMIISYFAGRVADTGCDPALRWGMKKFLEPAELLWASSREVLNIYQAEKEKFDIITCTPDLIRKYEKFKGMDLNELSLLTVKQFYDDAQSCGYTL